ncbi:hypothetical protein [Pseudomonas sp. 37 R 15]|nr:hypothetical protein [Pseudomonas sp. 37 R 15]
MRSGERLLRRSVRQRQRLAVELAVGGHRQLGQRDEMGRHHVFRQTAEQPCLEVARGIAFKDQISHQLLAAVYQDDGFAHLRVLHQARFDLAQFDAQTAQLDLVVEAAEVFDHPVGALTHTVTGPVQALAGHEWARHKALGGQRRAAMVTARQPGAAQVQLARDTGRYRIELGIEHVGAEVGNRPANGHAVGALVDAGPVGHIDGGFGRAVEVVQGRIRQLGEHLALRVQRQRFAAADNALEAGASVYAWLMDERLQHGRHEVHGGDGVPLDGLDQTCRLTVLPRRGDHQARAGHQRPEKLPHRNVEAERRFLQHRVAAIECIGLLHPAQTVDQRTMAVTGALGLAGGAGGVDHIGQVQPMEGDVRGRGAVGVEPVGRLIQGNHLDPCGRQSRQQVLLAEQQRDAAVFDHVGQAFPRVFRVQRDVGAACLEGGQQAHDHVDGTLGTDTHQPVRADASLA